MLRLAIFLGLLSSFAARAEVVLYDNYYDGVRPGRSAIVDVERLWGKPFSTQVTPNGWNFRYSKVIVNVSGESRTLVNTIIIDNDRDYQCPRGFKLGNLLAFVRRPVKGEDSFTDEEQGITYWLRDGRITKNRPDREGDCSSNGEAVICGGR